MRCTITRGHIEHAPTGLSDRLANRLLVRERSTELLDRLAGTERGRTGHRNGALDSAEQPDCRDNESADGDHAPREITGERSDFGAQHVRRDMLTVLGGLPNGIRDGVGLFRRELGGGQRASDGVGVEHRGMVPRVLTWLCDWPVGFVSRNEDARGVAIPVRPRPVSLVLRNPIQSGG